MIGMDTSCDCPTFKKYKTCHHLVSVFKYGLKIDPETKIFWKTNFTEEEFQEIVEAWNNWSLGIRQRCKLCRKEPVFLEPWEKWWSCPHIEGYRNCDQPSLLHRFCKDCITPALQAQRRYLNKLKEEEKQKKTKKKKSKDESATPYELQCPICENVLENEDLK